MINEEELKSRLVDDLDCPIGQSEALTHKLLGMNAEVFQAFETWFRTGKSPDFRVEGFSVEDILRYRPQGNIISAYLALDWLKREPQRAKLLLTKPMLLNAQQYHKTKI